MMLLAVIVIDYNNTEILKFAIENGMLDLSGVREEMGMKERKEYISMHKYTVWEGKNHKYYTHFQDESKKEGRRLVERATRKGIEDSIVEFYKEIEKNPTVESVFEEWSTAKLNYGEIKKQSYDKYCTTFERYFHKIKDRKIKNIGEEEIEDFIKTTIHEFELDYKSYANMRIVLRGIFKYAKRRKYTEFSITNFFGDMEISQSIFKKKAPSVEHEIYSEDEIPLIIGHLRRNEDIKNLGLLIIFETGLRIGELSTLSRGDIHANVEDDIYFIEVSRTEIKYKAGGKWTVGVQDLPKTINGARRVYISAEGYDDLKKVMRINPFGEYLFMIGGNRIRGTYFNKRLKRVCEKLCIVHKPPHKIRKTYGTTLLDANVDESFVAEQMGHKNISTTKKYYYLSNKNEKSKSRQVSDAMRKWLGTNQN